MPNTTPVPAQSLGQDLLNVPFGEMVQKLGLAIAQAQLELDRTSVRIAQLMAGYTEDENGNLTDDDSVKVRLKATGDPYTLLELGFTPTFYQFVDTIIEVKISISISQTDDSSRTEKEKTGTQGAWQRFWTKKPVSATSVNAQFASKFQYSAEGSSLMRTKLVPIPPPAIFEERIRRLMEADTAPANTPA